MADTTDDAEINLTVDALRIALKFAVRELAEHNAEYNHKTPPSKIEFWRRLAAGDPETETRARLAALGEMCRAPTLARSPSVRAAIEDAGRHVFVDLPRWEDDGGASW